MSQKVSKFNQESIDKEQELLLYKREIESKFERKQEEWEEERKLQRKDLFEREESLKKAMAEFKMSMDMQRHESEMKIRSESLALQNKEGNIKHKEDELQITESKIREDQDTLKEKNNALQKELTEFKLQQDLFIKEKNEFESQKASDMNNWKQTKTANEQAMMEELQQKKLELHLKTMELQISSVRIKEKENAIANTEKRWREKLNDDRDVTMTLKNLLTERKST